MNTNTVFAKEATIHNANNSCSLVMAGNYTTTNRKSRFVRTITNKTLGKGF
jgi:hypothetical protein